MNRHFKTVLALLFVASVPLRLSATPHSPSDMSTEEVRKAEATAKTSGDHARLAAYYQSKAERTQKRLANAQDLMKQWNWLASSGKIPNPYWSARTQADTYRAQLDKLTKLAADHRKMAESLRASTRSSQ